MLLEKKNFSIKIKDQHPDLDKLNFIYSKKVLRPFCCKSMKLLLNKYKSFINQYDNWDQIKKISNNFELINQNGNMSITKINPLSRSFYKFIEIITDFELIPKDKDSINYSALAEGPGGFIEAFLHLRKKEFFWKNDYIQCMTLSSYSNDIPNWFKAKKTLNSSNINYCYGSDGTGDLYNVDNIIFFREKMGGNNSDLVSADGGFDYSKDFSKQEELSYRLIFSELTCAYGVNKKGGHFVIKIFDVFMLPTIQIIYLLANFYEEVIIVKPNTSRPANSEKYLVCKKFKGFNQCIYDNLLDCLKNWKLDTLFKITNLNVPRDFINYLSYYNLHIINNQIRNILKTIMFIKARIDCEELKYIKNIQILYATQWCIKYKIPYNSN